MRLKKEIFMLRTISRFPTLLTRLALASALACVSVSLTAPALSQDAVPGPEPATVGAVPVIPQQVRYAGKLATRAGDTVEAVFRIYASAEGGEPLWTETQKITIAEDGSYSVLLGSAEPRGLPQTVFAGGVARWLGVSVERGAETERVMLASVPYAMKSADAEALSGHAAADFVTQEQLAALAAANNGQPTGSTGRFSPETSGPVTGSGTSGTIPLWTGALTQGNSNMVQVGSQIGINETTPAAMLDINGTEAVRGTLSLPPTAPATAAKGYPSQTLQFGSSVWSATTAAPVAQNFSLATIPVGNNTASPSASLLLQYQNGTGTPTGVLSIGSTGLISFASGQLFPGTITGATATSPLIAGVSGHNITMQLNETSLLATFNATYAQLANSNSFTGSQSIKGGLSLTSGLTAQSTSVTGVSSATQGFKSYGAIAATPATLATAAAAQNSPQLQLGASAFNSGSAAAVAQTYAWQTLASGNNTASPSANLALLFGSGAATPAATGLSISSNGNINFSPTQTFPITGTGGGTITGIITTSPLTGSGATGSVALGLNTSALETTLNTVYPQLATSNAFTLGATFGGPIAVSLAADAAPFTSAIQGTASSDSVLGVYGHSPSYIGVYGRSDTSYGVAAFSTSNDAVDATSYTGNAIYAESAGSADNPGEALSGVYGFTLDPGPGNAGVLGNAYALSTEYSTVKGDDFTAGVWADSADDTDGIGITPISLIATADDNEASLIVNNSSSKVTLYVENASSGGPTGLFKTFMASTPDGTCGFGGAGTLTCTGQVKTLATTGGGARKVETYAMQSPENWMEDFGSGSLQRGVAVVKIDPTFADTVTGDTSYHVFVTPNGDADALYVINKTATSFEVRESKGGTSSLTFDYRIVAKRRGFEAQRLTDVTDRFNVERAHALHSPSSQGRPSTPATAAMQRPRRPPLPAQPVLAADH